MITPTTPPDLGYALRAGYLYVETPIPDANVNGLGVGLGLQRLVFVTYSVGGVEEAL